MKLYVIAPDAAYAEKVRAAGGIPITSTADVPEPVVSPKDARPGAVVHGALDRTALQRAAQAGAAGVVLAAQLWLLPESPLDDADKQALARLTRADFEAGDAALPSARIVGRDALLAPFVVKRSGSLARALADVLADAGRPAAPMAPPPAPAPAPAPAAAPKPTPPPAPATGAREDVLKAVVQMVSEKTGYPADMLDPDLDMEADLGIDTVKQAELFGALREKFSVPRDETLQLKDFPTLRKVAEYMSGGSRPSAPAPAGPAPAAAPLPAAPAPVVAPKPAPAPVAAASGSFETAPPEEAVAIIGVGAVLPKANSAQQFWDNVLNKVNAIVDVPRDRWDPAIHYDPDPSKEDKTYTKIGGFVTDFTFDPLKFRIPPSVAKALDPVQQMALTAAAEALTDAGYDKKPFDRAKCAVILGNSLGGERKDETNKRMHLAEFTAEARRRGMPENDIKNLEADIKKTLPSITEDTMPGELSNVIAGRLANVLNLGGKNLTTDAACASSHAALDTAVKAILGGEADMVLCGGADRSMDPGTYVKFSKIGALSAHGSTPFDARADGFVMGEGVAILLLKRLSDAVRDGDKVYCVVRGMGSSSDGKGKGITAPNPDGQKLAVKRAFQTAEVLPKHVGLVEAHGTSTKVGDVVEVESISALFEGVPPRTVALGSVKSQIGHLKSAAGAAGVLKAALALHHKLLPPSINFQTPNPNIQWDRVPFFVNTDAKPWPSTPNGEPRRAAVSAFGFGGTNFHVILEEYVPSYHNAPRRKAAQPKAHAVAPLIEAELVVLGADSVEGLVAETANAKSLVAQHATLEAAAAAVRTPRAHLKAHRLAIGADSRATLTATLDAVQPLLPDPKGRMALPLKVKNAVHGEGPKPAGKVAFLFPGQGSQYANMCGDLAKRYPVVRETFDEADAVLEPLLGRKLSALLFVDPKDKDAVARAEEALKQTEVTQPAMLAADVAILRLLGEHGVKPDMVGGHSLGEYAALVAAGVLSFKDALLAVSARGKEMANVHVPDKGLMASFSCGPEQAEQILRTVEGYVVAANKNCPVQTVIAGETAAVKKAMEAAKAAGVEAMLLPVSAAFHTSIVAPASAPLRRVLDRLDVQPPKLPVYTNVDATLYPSERNAILDILSKQVAAPVEWVAELNAMHEAGARVFIEVGPKRALAGFVDATLGKKPGVVALVTNHPKTGDIPTFFQALGKLGVMGFELRFEGAAPAAAAASAPAPAAHATVVPTPSADYAAFRQAVMPALESALQQGWASAQAEVERLKGALAAFEKYGFQPVDVVVSGASMGLPGQARRVFSDDNAERLFAGENRIDRLDAKWAERFIEKDLVRLVKDAGEPRMEKVQDPKEVLKLAGRRGDLDLEKDYFVPAKLVKTLDITSKLAIAAAYEALHDAGIPMVRESIVTTTGKTLPGDWVLPPHLQDGTGVVFASAFPGYDNFVQEVARHLARRYGSRTLAELDALYHEMLDAVPAEKKSRVSAFYAKHAGELHKLAGDEKGLEGFNRHFLFSILSMGHAELAETISARGPNTQVNAACSSSTQAIAIAEDWLRTGRAQRVLVVGADDVTSENMLEWIGSGFLVSGAATTAGSVEEGALPFDRRRHGMIIGMGAVGLVLEKREDVEARGMVPVARLVATRINNSAYHGSRLHVEHIAKEARTLVETAAKRLGTTAEALGAQTIFVSHETYTPARGGSASAEAAAMRAAFGSGATKVLVTNTKGFTGHPMGAGIEDALAVKSLQFGKVPPIANLRDTDPEFADLNLSRGGAHDRRFAMRFSAGFGSQLAMAFFEKMADGPQRIRDAARYQSFLDQCSGVPGAKAERVGRVLRITTAVAAPTKVPVTAAAPEPIATPVAPPAQPRTVPVSSTPSPMTAGVPTLTRDAVLAKVVALVAEKTGYPTDMLDPNLDMEADLGIDTVKQAEIFGQLREQFAIPREEGLTLKDYPTLAKVADYMHSRLGSVGASTAPSVPMTDKVAPAPIAPNPVVETAPEPGKGPGSADEILQKVTGIIAARTGYPPEMLDPTLNMEADLGIDTVKQAEIFGEVRETFNIPRVEGIQLKDYPTISHVAGFVQTHAGRAPGAAQQSSAAPLATANPPPSQAPTGLIRRVPRVVEAHAEGTTQRNAYVVGHGDLADALKRKFPGDSGQVAVFNGTARELFAFAKKNAAKLESGDLGILTVTHLGGEHAIPGEARPAHPEDGGVTGMAKALHAEFPKAFVRALDLDPSEPLPERVDHVAAELRVDHSLVEVGRRAGKRYAVRTIAAGTTGGDRPTLPQRAVLLVTGGARGITAEVLKALAPQKPILILLGRTQTPTDADLAFDEARARDRAKADMASRGERVTPVALEKSIAPLKARAEVARTLQSLKAAGASVEYHAADAADPISLERVLVHVRNVHGPVTGVIHAAGVEESKKLADKDDGAFDRAWKPKAEAALHLARLTEKDKPRFFVMFGSVAGRYGNAAQADYSAANDCLAKLARALRAKGVAGAVFCWGPWGETGMATRGSTLKVLSAAGVDAITTEEGVGAFLSELARLDEPEVVLAKSLGQLEGAATHSTRTMTLKADEPAMDHHRVDGVPFLAGVQGLQAFVDASQAHVTGFEDVHFQYPAKLLRDQPLDITVEVDSVGNAKLTSLAPGPMKQVRTHFTGALLTAPHDAPPARAFEGQAWGFGSIYPPFFHGPAFQVLGRAARVSFDGIEVEGRAPAPGISPMAATLEGAFQALGLWGLAVARRMALPERIRKATLHGGYQPGATTYRVFGARLHDGRVVGDVQCVVDGKVVAALHGVSLIVTGPAPPLETPQAWRADKLPLKAEAWKVPVADARLLLERPDLAPAWLSEKERATLAGFGVEKRREEWLAATLAGKTALRAAGDSREWTAIEVLRGEDGAPLPHGSRGLTLGHAAGVAVARAFDLSRERAGVDVERVEARPASFEAEAFAEDERAAFPSGDARPAAVTLAWCAKEAVLKALGVGLSVDLHGVRVRSREGRLEVELQGRAKDKFVELDGASLEVDARIEGETGMAVATVTLVRRTPSRG